MAEELLAQFDKTRAYCFELFKAKNADYGPTWLLYRPQSLNDEIWRKAKRIRTLEEHGDRACIHEGRDVEYVGIINYCIMFLIKLQSAPGLPSEADLTDDISVLDGIGEDVLTAAYQAQMDQVRTLLAEKSGEGKTQAVKALLYKYDAGKLSGVKPEDYAALMEEARKL